MRLPRNEQVVRAVCSEHYDRESGRVSPSLYEGTETSLSRLTIIPLAGQWAKLAATVQKLPGRRLEKIGELGVAQIEDAGRNYTQNGDTDAVDGRGRSYSAEQGACDHPGKNHQGAFPRLEGYDAVARSAGGIRSREGGARRLIVSPPADQPREQGKGIHPGHKRHAEARGRLGDGFDSAHFDSAETKDRLDQIPV